MKSQESLKSKTIKGTAWSAADAFLGQGVTFLVGIVLARLLSPDEYGLIGICLIFITILNGIVDSGFSNALIRKKNVTDTDYNTMFITNMVISVLLYVALFFVSRLVSEFFARPELTYLLRVMGLVLFANALSITQVTILSKKIDFRTKTKASLFSSIFSGIVGIVLAIAGLGVWSLVAQQLIRQFLYSISLWFLNRWWPKLSFSRVSFYYMWEFGWKLMLSGLLNNVWNQLYQTVVGKCYSPSSLGQYTRANEYSTLFSANITSIIQRVSYPVLSEMQDDKERMLQGYRKIIKETMFISVLCMIFMGAVSEPLIYCMIGPQWHEAASYLPLICLSMSLYPLHAINLNILQVLGRSDIFLYLEIVKKFIGIAPILIGIYYDIYWMLLASVFTGWISLYLNSYYNGKILGYTVMKQLKDIAPSYYIAFFVAVCVYFFKYFNLSYWIILPLQVLVGFFLVILICEYMRIEEYLEIKMVVKKMLEINV